MLRPRAHSIILPIVLIFLRRTFRIHSPIVAREQLLVGVLIGSIPLVVFIVKSLVYKGRTVIIKMPLVRHVMPKLKVRGFLAERAVSN